MAYKPPFTRAPGGAPSAGPATLRRANPSLVLRELREHASLSRADIAQATGLHRATVSNLMAELLERRLVREVGVKLQPPSADSSPPRSASAPPPVARPAW
ncbi:helix-turn-helix domain-containing protein [Sphaerisporangium sp. NPDC005289]|uniref:helix-turn-helix domain-containing protein n=1 Tax=Sphaerisporangium sp. NPDC005289 TaxID=3155247 RepID=UPI0033A04EBF